MGIARWVGRWHERALKLWLNHFIAICSKLIIKKGVLTEVISSDIPDFWWKRKDYELALI